MVFREYITKSSDLCDSSISSQRSFFHMYLCNVVKHNIMFFNNMITQFYLSSVPQQKKSYLPEFAVWW